MYRRLLKISWIGEVTNEEVIQIIHKEIELLLIIKERKLEYFGHMIKNSQKMVQIDAHLLDYLERLFQRFKLP